MLPEPRSAPEVFEVLVREFVLPPLKQAGFRKTRMNFHRRYGQTVQVVNLQSSVGSSWQEKVFFVNAGIAFDAICELAGLPVIEKPKEWECDSRGTRGRLEKLIEGAPAEWAVHPSSDVHAIGTVLERHIVSLVEELGRIDGPASYRAHRWFNQFRPKPENAQVFYVLGDLDAAWEEVCALTQFFADRQGANQPLFWIDGLGLAGLRERVEPGSV